MQSGPIKAMTHLQQLLYGLFVADRVAIVDELSTWSDLCTYADHLELPNSVPPLPLDLFVSKTGAFASSNSISATMVRGGGGPSASLAVAGRTLKAVCILRSVLRNEALLDELNHTI